MDAVATSISSARVSTTKRRWLSAKPIPVNERLIVALDTPDVDQAKALVELLGEHVHFYKLGFELLISGKLPDLLCWLAEKDKKTLVDIKFFDIPRTVSAAVRQLKGMGASFVTVHGNDRILRAACEAGKGYVKILAVTVLTSLDKADLKDLGFPNVPVKDLVLSRAKRALKIGCSGVISSGQEARELRNSLGENFLIVCPGIRPVENRETDDQKRTVTVRQAFERGADYVVIGRPIRTAADPVKAAVEVQEQIQQVFEAP